MKKDLGIITENANIFFWLLLLFSAAVCVIVFKYCNTPPPPVITPTQTKKPTNVTYTPTFSGTETYWTGPPTVMVTVTPKSSSTMTITHTSTLKPTTSTMTPPPATRKPEEDKHHGCPDWWMQACP